MNKTTLLTIDPWPFSTLYKIYISLINFRLSHQFDKHVQKTQYGFRKQKVTNEAIGAIRRAIAKGESTQTSTLLLALDLEKGFDKVTHTASIECRHWYVWVCLQRLLSDAFKPIAFPNCDFSDYAHLTPWATELDYEFQPAILFGTAKQHKRMKDPLAYRWITSACSWISTPLSNEAVRVLTTLWHKACVDCMALSRLTGGKYFWSIDSLDTVPLNIDTTVQRLLRQPVTCCI